MSPAPRRPEKAAKARPGRRTAGRTTRARRFAADVLDAIRESKILGIRAGTGPHRFIGIWAVVVEGRVFVRSWSLKPRSWQRTLAAERRGTVQIAGREIPVRAVRTRSERLNGAPDRGPPRSSFSRCRLGETGRAPPGRKAEMADLKTKPQITDYH